MCHGGIEDRRRDCSRLASLGYRVICVARSEAKVNALAREINSIPLALDVTDSEAIEQAITQLEGELWTHRASRK